MADWIQTGELPFALNEFEPARYGKWTNKEYVFTKCCESYVWNTIMMYPKEERYAGRSMRTSPLYEVLCSHFCSWF